MVDDPNKTEDNAFMDDDFLAADEPATDNVSRKQSFKEIWNQNPSVKIFAIIGGILFLLIAFMVFGGDSDKPSSEEISAMRANPDVSQPPGTAELPPAYEEAVRQANEQIAQSAEVTGDSAIPTPIARPSERIEAPVQVEENDPLSEWRREAEARRMERQQQEEANQQVIEPPSLPVDPNAAALAAQNANQQPQNPPLPVTPSPEQVQAMAAMLQQQMQTVMEAQIPKDSVVVAMNVQPGYDMKKYFPDPIEEANKAGAQAGAQTAAQQQQLQAEKPKPIITAGTIVYAQILTEANSDVPGPVLAEIASGPFLGGRAIGSFSVAQRHLVLQFTRVVLKETEYPVQGFALDPATTLPGVVSDIDNHYFRRVFLPAAAAFVQGFAQAATQTNNDVVVSNGTVVTSNQNDLDTRQELLRGAQEAGNQLSEVIDEDADRPRTIKVYAGTRIGILFLNSVFDPNTLNQQPGQYGNTQQQQQTGAGGIARAAFGASPYGQAYNAYQNYQQNSQTASTGGQTAANGVAYPAGQQQSIFNTPAR